MVNSSRRAARRPPDVVGSSAIVAAAVWCTPPLTGWSSAHDLLQVRQHVVVDPGEALRRERPLEEAADPARTVPRRDGPDSAAPGLDRLDQPGGDHARV